MHALHDRVDCRKKDGVWILWFKLQFQYRTFGLHLLNLRALKMLQKIHLYTM